MKAAASLTAGLLVAKGGAAPSAKSDRFGGDSKVEVLPRRAGRRASGGNEGITRMTLRLNTARHLRLRLAAAHLGRSHHALAIAAIDHYIDNVLPLLLAGRCACLEQGRASEGGCPALGFGRAMADTAS
jgi:hypothetical protein